MKKNSTSYYIKLPFLLLTCLMACDDDDIDELALLTDAELIIEQSNTNADEVAIDVSLSNPEVVSAITYYVNDQVIANQPAFPFTAIWNTKGLEDNTYSIKAEITTQQGEEKVLSEAYTLSKSLFKLQVEEGYFHDFVADSWILLSDTNGNLIDYRSTPNGARINIERPAGFTDQQFHVTTVEVIDHGDGFSTSVITYLYQKKDEWLYDAVNQTTIFAEGNTDFKITNIPNTGRYNIHTSPPDAGSSSNFINTSELQITKGLYQNPSSIYLGIIADGGSGKYTILDEVYVSESLNLDYLSMDDLSFKTIPLPENDFYFFRLLGIQDPDNPSDDYTVIDRWLYTEPNNGITYSYPPGLSDHFLHDMLVITDELVYAEKLIGNIPESIQIPEYTHQFDIRSHKDFSYSVTGPFDFMVIGDSNVANNFRWTVHGPTGTNYNVKLPELPQEITGKYDHIDESGLTHESFGLQNHFDIEGYDEYLTKVFKLNDGKRYVSREHKYLSVTLEAPANSGGRKLNDYSGLPGEVQRYLKQYNIDLSSYKD